MKQLLYLMTILLLLSSCDSVSLDKDELITQIPIPEVTNDGWKVASLNSVGMNEEKYIQLINRLGQNNEHRIHSIIVVKDQKLVFEKYYPGTLLSKIGFYFGRHFNRI